MICKSVMTFITNMPNYGVSIRNHIVMKPIRYISYHFRNLFDIITYERPILQRKHGLI